MVNLSTRPDPRLLEKQKWICWGYDQDERGTLKKPPYDPISGRMIDVTQPGRRYASFDQALQTFISNRSQKYHGLGYVFGPDDHIIRIDLDEVRDPATGTIASWARRLIEHMHSYTEFSPSGDGIHILVAGQLCDRDRKFTSELINIEMYSQSTGYLTWTGESYPGMPATIEDRSDLAQTFYDRIFWSEIWNEYKSARKKTPGGGSQEVPEIDLREERSELEILADNNLLKRARNARNGRLFSQLYDNLPEGKSQHEDDYRLCLLLLYWTQDGEGKPDISRAYRLFMASQRYLGRQHKWHRKLGAYTYGEVTLWKAFRDRYISWEPDTGLSDRREGEDNGD